MTCLFQATYGKDLKPTSEDVIAWLVESGQLVTFSSTRNSVQVTGTEEAVGAFVQFAYQKLGVVQVSLGAIVPK